MDNRTIYKKYLVENYRENLPKSTKYYKRAKISTRVQPSSSSESSSSAETFPQQYEVQGNLDATADHSVQSRNINLQTTHSNSSFPPDVSDVAVSNESIHDSHIQGNETLYDSIYADNYDEYLYDSTDDDFMECDNENEEYRPESFTKLFEMLEADEFNQTITAEFIVNKLEILLAILKFSERYGLPNIAIIDLCKMINSFGDRPLVPDTKYEIDRLFNTGEGVEYHAVCPICKMYIKKFERKDRNAVCQVCNNSVSLKDPCYRDFFVTLDVRNDVRNLIESNSDYYNYVISEREQQGFFSDIYDGQMYKKFIESLPDDDKKSYVTFTFNSDGSPVFKSSKCSVWPIQIIPNEVPVHVRQQKPIKFAFWFGHDKPIMTIFLKHFVERFNELSNIGVPCKIGNEIRMLKLFGICCCVDSVARAPMQGMIQFNGKCGCNWCLHPGELVMHDRGRTIKYPLLDEIPTRRNEADTIQHMRQTITSLVPVFGVKRVSPLVNLKTFNIIDGFVPDAMHCIALGVVKQISEYWFASSGKPYSLSNYSIQFTDKHIKLFQVPIHLARLSRSINDRKYWKAREWENWLLYYSLPILQQIPNFQEYLNHWALLVQAFYLLMKDIITIFELREANDLLKKFVALTEYLYTKDAMSYNIHQLTHIPQSVADWGPLWAHSGYAFESGNGQVVRSVHAAKGVIHQMCRNISMYHNMTILEQHVAKKEYSPVMNFCYYLENRCTQKTDKVGCNRYFGRKYPPIARSIRELNLSEDCTVAYQRLVKNKCLFTSSLKYCNRSNNSYAQTKEGDYIEIIQFLYDRTGHKEYTMCKKILVRNTFSNICTSVKEIVNIEEHYTAVETNNITNVCVFMKVNRKSYISGIPNLHWY